MTIEKHYTTAELMDLLSCSSATIYRLAQKGDIPSSLVGSERRYPESGIRAYLDRSMNAPPVLASLVPLRETRDSQRRTG